MAVPSYATDLVDITTSFTLNWNLISEGGGGQNAITAPEVDDFIQGTESVSRNPFSSSIRGIAYDRALITVAAGDAVFVWWKADVAAALDTIAGGGVHVCIGATLTDYKKYYVAGNDTYALGGWRCSPIDPSNAGSLDRGTPGAAPYDTFGMAFDVPASGPTKGFPFKCDMIRHGRQIDITNGEIADPATWAKLATQADLTANRWGIVQGTATGATLQGVVNWGTAATLCYSRDSNRAIVIADTLGFTPTDFTQIVFNNASTDLEWDGMSITSLDTLNRGIITVNNNAAVTVRGSVITGINTTADGGTNSTWDGTTWNACNAVTAAGGSFVDCNFLAPTVAADTSALVWNIATNPNGLLDGASFSAHGSTLHHGVEFGVTSPTTIDLVGVTFTGFSASNNVNNSMIHIKRTTGTVTINITEGGTSPSYRTDGAIVNIVSNPVTYSVTSQTSAGAAVVTTVFLKATSGSLPVEDSVSLAYSGTVCTATHTAHGLVSGDKVYISGSSKGTLVNGVRTVTVTDANTYTFPSTATATEAGTPTSTFVLLYGDTNGSGLISASRSLPSNIGVTGWARKGSTAPYYKTGPLSGTVSSTTGASFTAIMVPDE